MNEFGLLDKDMQMLIYVLQKFPEVNKGIIFGSRAKGNFKQGSDVDIAIVCSPAKENISVAISGQLNEDLPMPYKFDVLDYNSISNAELKNHIDRVGKIIYQS